MNHKHSKKGETERKKSQNTTSIKIQNQEKPKRTIKDSVFRNLFSEPRYGLELYKILHPEDTKTTEEDIAYTTISREITNGIRNDLGMCIGGRYLIMIEAQSTWSVNILIRMYIYLAEIWKNYIVQNGLDVFSTKELDLPVPEFYVVYTGNRKNRPKFLRLSDDIFHGTCKNIELTIRMLYNGENKGDILDQYVSFTEQADYFYKKYGRTKEAAEKLVEYCIAHNILTEYLNRKKEEVTSMIGVIFDDTIHRQKMQEEAEARGEARGTIKGEKQGQIKKARETALRLCRRGYNAEAIAEIVDMPGEQVKEWLAETYEKNADN